MSQELKIRIGDCIHNVELVQVVGDGVKLTIKRNTSFLVNHLDPFVNDAPFIDNAETFEVFLDLSLLGNIIDTYLERKDGNI